MLSLALKLAYYPNVYLSLSGDVYPPLPQFWIGGLTLNELVVGDTSPLQFNLIDYTGAQINITGGSVSLRYQIEGGSVITRTCTITAATQGQCQYAWEIGELTAGTLEGEVAYTDSSGLVTTSSKFQLQVRSQI